MLSRRREGFQSGSVAVPTTGSAAITEYYTNTFLVAARYLPATELTTERTIGGINTTFYQVARKAVFCSGSSPIRLTGGDTDASIVSLMNAATRFMTSAIISAYSSTFATWSGRGVSITQATTSDPGGSDLTVAVLTARNAYIGTGGHWPLLITAIQSVINNTVIANAIMGYGLLTGTPVGAGKLALAAKPIVATLDASGATLFGSHGGATSVGFFWKATDPMGAGDSITGGNSVSGSVTGNNFTATLSSLTAGTTYYYKAWATNATGTSYGVERSFAFVGNPTVTTGTIVRAPAMLTISGEVVTAPGARIIERGIAWGTTAPTVATIPTLATKAIDISGNVGTFSIALGTTSVGLVAGTSYSFLAYAINERGTVAIGSATTAAFPNPPTLATPTSASPTTNSIVVSCTITAFGTATNLAGIRECGFIWSTSQTSIDAVTTTLPSAIETTPAIGTSELTTTSNVYRVIATKASPVSTTITHTSITFGTTIHYKAYVITNTDGTTVSSRGSGTTTDAVPPTVTTTTLIPTTLSVTFSGDITANGGADITDRGILYVQSSVASLPALTKSTTNVQVLEDTPNSLVTGPFTRAAVTLVTGQKYFYVAYATNVKGTSYGSILNFTMPSNPTVQHNNYTSTRTQITVRGTITSVGGSTITSAGIVYSTSNTTPTISDTIANASSPVLSTQWSVSFTAADTTTTYYVRTYVTTPVGTAYSDTVLQAKGFSVTAPSGTLTTTSSGSTLYAFTSSSSFTVTGRNVINYFVVGGGGGGGNSGGDRTGGGGGAGGLLYSNTTNFIEGSYTVTVGAGGTADSSGNSSSISGPAGFSTITATGGGKGQGSTSAASGGSGGGARHGTSSGANGTSGQGNSGGRGYDGGGDDNSQYSGGGGGGAGGAGTAGSSSGGGAGGAGITMSNTYLPGWTTTIGGTTFPSSYCGGGGGGFQNRANTVGSGGTGSNGGGNGARAVGKPTSISSDGTSGTQYTGGGGGGCAYTDGGTAGTNTGLKSGGSGGSGVVFISINSSFL